jgi:hypothetical protein
MYQRLFGLAASLVCLIALASGCAVQLSPPGTVSGFFETSGGPPNAAPRPLSGTVVFTSSSGNSRALEVRANGSIVIRLAAGTWTATGHSPLVMSGSHEESCRSTAPIVVHSGRTTHANVICELL